MCSTRQFWRDHRRLVFINNHKTLEINSVKMSGGGNKKELYRSIAEQKLKSFSIGSMGKRGVSRKEQEDLRKKQDEEEVGKVYEEFVSTFEDAPSSKVSKTWVKAGTFNAGNRKEDNTDRGKLYKPQSKVDFKSGSKQPPDSNLPKKPDKPGKKKQTEKKKSNLEIFKEELKAIQEEREERHRIKGMVKISGGFGSGSSATASASSSSVTKDSNRYNNLHMAATFEHLLRLWTPTKYNLYIV
jgi:hypothetical protein